MPATDGYVDAAFFVSRMRSRGFKLPAEVHVMLSRLLLAVVALGAAASLSPARAQLPPGVTPMGDKNLKEDDSIRTRSVEMERIRRDAAKPDRKPEPNPADRFPQIKEDFERVQILNGDVLQAPGAPDYARLAEAAEEVKKRATRLSSNLFPPEAGKKPKKDDGKKNDGKQDAAAEPEQRDLKSLLSALDESIARFVNSPVFQNTKVVNPDESAKARKELEEIIKLSTRVEQEAARMKKPSGG